MTKTDDSDKDERHLERVTRVVCAFLGANQQPVERIGEIIRTVTTALANGGTMPGPTIGARSAENPAVPIKKSVGDDFLICLEDGKRLTMLKRYLKAQHAMTPEQYRAKWGLPADYPMVAPAYARLRSDFAKKIGLGTVRVSGSRKGRRK